MIIQCERCETTYNFDEALLTSGCVNVRCVRCKHVFNVCATTAPTAVPLPEETTITTDFTTPAPQQPQQPSEEPQQQIVTEEPTFEATVPDLSAAEDTFTFSEADSFSFNNESEDTTPQRADNNTHQEPEAKSTAKEFNFESLAPDSETVEALPTESSVFNEEPVLSETGTTEPVDKQPTKPNKKTSSKEKKPAKTSKLAWFFLFILMLVAATYGYFYITLDTADVMKMIQSVQQQLVPSAPQQPQGSIQVDSGESYYVDNVNSGHLFIIKGHAINKYSAPRSELKVIATLYKDKGIPLLKRSVYCGNIITDNELKNIQLDEIIKRTDNPFGTALSNVSIAPGQSLPFMVVFNKIPENLSEFSVEAESSKPASK